jgi:hypothetical protein
MYNKDDIVIISKEQAMVVEIVDPEKTKYVKCKIIMLGGKNKGQKFLVNMDDLTREEKSWL